jgi:hypothetical protein
MLINYKIIYILYYIMLVKYIILYIDIKYILTHMIKIGFSSFYFLKMFLHCNKWRPKNNMWMCSWSFIKGEMKLGHGKFGSLLQPVMI